MDTIEIRALHTIEACEVAEQLEIAVWGMAPVEVVPSRMLHAFVHNGSLLLGAYHQKELIGFVLGILALTHQAEAANVRLPGHVKMYSVMAGVKPGYQRYGVGYRLKMAQREAALKMGVRLITWTYDPLESVNGRLNIGKLGVVCHHYHRNFHGEMSGINRGLSTDRFDVSWWLASARVQARANQPKMKRSLVNLLREGVVLLNETTRNMQGQPVPPDLGGLFELPRAGQLLVEIPANFQAVKRADFELALRWRAHTRLLFERLFEEGYVVTEFIYQRDEMEYGRSFYLLTQDYEN